MPATNDITGDRLVSKANTKEYETNYDKIFKKKIELPKDIRICNNCGEPNDWSNTFCDKCGTTF